MHSPNKEEELSPIEAAEILRCSDKHVRRLVLEGKLPARMVGNRYKLAKTDVVEFFQKSFVQPKRTA